MSIVEVSRIMQESIYITILISSPVLIVSIVMGLIIAILQAVTSIQDQTISFIPKIIAIFLVLVIFGPWMLDVLVQFTITLFNRIPDMIK